MSQVVPANAKAHQGDPTNPPALTTSAGRAQDEAQEHHPSSDLHGNTIPQDDIAHISHGLEDATHDDDDVRLDDVDAHHTDSLMSADHFSLEHPDAVDDHHGSNGGAPNDANNHIHHDSNTQTASIGTIPVPPVSTHLPDQPAHTSGLSHAHIGKNAISDQSQVKQVGSAPHTPQMISPYVQPQGNNASVMNIASSQAPSAPPLSSTMNVAGSTNSNEVSRTPGAKQSIRKRSSPQGPFVCDVLGCGKLFGKKFNLKAHMRVHTGDEPFACSFPLCGKKFKWKSSLSFHERLHLSTPEDPGPIVVSSVPTSTVVVAPSHVIYSNAHANPGVTSQTVNSSANVAAPPDPVTSPRASF